MSQLLPRSSKLLWTAALTLLAIAAVGCQPGTGVGDPCDPESIPGGGFDPQEVYLETSSVQCRTRVCMVYEIMGLPSDSEANQNDVYCTCRCDAPAGGSNTPTCDCPSGFVCETILEQGGTGIQGGYCVREDEVPAP